MKTRLLGAAVLLALLVLFVPMFFSSKPPAPGGDQTVSLAIPPAPDRDLQTKTMSLTPDAPMGAAVASSAASANAAPVKPAVTLGSGASASQPVIAMQNKPVLPASAATQPSVATAPPKPAKAPKVAAETPAATSTAAPATIAASPADTAHGSYMLNLSAYASAAGAASLEKRVRALSYPVNSHVITQAGKSRTLVMAGPFETRTAAEAARLKITQSIPGVPAHLQQDADTQAASAPAAATAKAVAAQASTAPTKGKPGGFAVQLAAMSSQRDANALRDKLRSSGFDGFVDSVQSGGKQLWRVRAGPQTQRSDAQRLHDQIKAKLGIDGNIVSVP